MFKRLLIRYLINPFTAILILGGLAYLGWFFQNTVDLTPQIRSDFFFSEKSKIYKEDAKVYTKFTVGNSIILTVPSKNISSQHYQNFIRKLSNKLVKIKGVTSVQSMTNGPDNLKSALKNPLWSRFLDTTSGKNSLIVCWIEIDNVTSIINEIRALLRDPSAKDFPVHISGIPFIIDEMRRMLSNDMKQFMAGAVIISSIVLLFIFLSIVATIGAIVTALAAAVLTLTIQHFMGVPVGILTANLGAIVYVITISHIVFLTSNWRQDKHKKRKHRLASTLLTTFPASFWSMATTLFGFISLIFVDAKPLQELGWGGSVGTLASLLTAYLVFPMFLVFSRMGKKQDDEEFTPGFPLPFRLRFGFPIALILIAGSSGIAWLGLKHLNTDPSLLTYFKSDQSIYRGIQSMDRFGGSNPMNFVISNKDGKKLTNAKSYQNMMNLQKDLEANPAVGAVLSLPVLMEETQTNWMARFLPWGSIMSLLSRDEFGKVARGFISQDFKQALFLIKMRETGRTVDRYKIVNQLKSLPGKHGLKLDLVGGSYYLQSELAKRIRESMKKGVMALFALFGIIIFLLSLSLPTTMYACTSIAATAATFAGVLGYYHIPVDIISSPSINIVLGLAVDGMIHMILAAKRLSNRRGPWTDGPGWIEAVRSQGQAVLISTLVIGAGFSVFYLSNFPPSQRFGMEIVFGTFVAMVMTLFVLPHLSLLFKNRDTLK